MYNNACFLYNKLIISELVTVSKMEIVVQGKATPRKSRLGGASVVQKGKRKMQVFDFQVHAFCWVPGGLSVFEPVYGRFR